MATTFIQAVNDILVESNEVVLNTANFASAVGLQDYAKSSVNRAYLEICAKEEEWPFLAAAESNTNEPYAGNTLVESSEGIRWYLLKAGSADTRSDFSKVDWDSFYMTSDGATAQVTPFEYENLTYTTFQHWKDRFQEWEDADTGSDGEGAHGIPSRVVESLDGRYFGLSPIPDGAYSVFFTAWVQPTQLSADTDAILIPDMYIPVLLSRAGYYLLKFKKDIDEARESNSEYKMGLKDMRRNLIGNPDDYMRDDWQVRRNF